MKAGWSGLLAVSPNPLVAEEDGAGEATWEGEATGEGEVEATGVEALVQPASRTIAPITTGSAKRNFT